MNGNVSAERPKQGGDHKISEEARMPKSPSQSKAHNGRARRDTDGAARSAEVKFSGSEEGQDDAIDLEPPTPVPEPNFEEINALPILPTCNTYLQHFSELHIVVPV